MRKRNKKKYYELRYPRYGESLLKCLELTGRSQKDLAHHIGRSQSSVSAYCHGFTLPDLDGQELILSFIDDRELCSDLEDHYYFYTSEVQMLESVDHIRDATVDDVRSLMSKGRLRQAAALMDGLLSWSADEELRLSLQELNFELSVTSAAYADAYQIALAVGTEDHANPAIPEFRSNAMLGIVLRAQGNGNLIRAQGYLNKAIAIANRSTKISPDQLAIVKRMKAMAELDCMNRAGTVNEASIKRVLKSLHPHIEYPASSEDRSNAIEAAARCYVLLRTPKCAHEQLKMLTPVEIEKVSNLEERVLIRKGVVLRMQGELDEALALFGRAVKRCKQKANQHHLRLANAALISLQEQIRSQA